MQQTQVNIVQQVRTNQRSVNKMTESELVFQIRLKHSAEFADLTPRGKVSIY